MQVSEHQNRLEKKRAKMAAKKLAKETGIPIPKEPKVYRSRRKTETTVTRIQQPKVSNYVRTIARNHVELQKLIEEERNLQISETDIDYPEKPAYTLDFYVSNNAKNLGMTLEFPDEKVTFLDPKKTCSELCKMLTGIGMKAILAKIETRSDNLWISNSLRLFIHEKDQSPLFHYLEKGELPNMLNNGSIRTTEATLILDIVCEEGKTKLYLTNIDGIRISIGSYLLDNTMIELDIPEARICFAKDIEYALRCALQVSLEGKLYKLANEYFAGDIAAMFLPSRVIG